MIRFKPIRGFPAYRVGDDGSVWSCLERGGSGRRRLTDLWHRVRPIRHRDGRLHVQLYGLDAKPIRAVHRLVLDAFVGPCPPGMEACHGDDDQTNNALSNLRWDTHRANIGDRGRNGLTARGERQGLAKLTESQVVDIKLRIAAGQGARSIAALFGVSPKTISSIKTGRTWRHVNG